MKAEDRYEFATCLTACQEALNRKPPLTEAAIEIYWSALADLSIEEFRLGLSRHCRSSRFFPSPADILEAVRGPAEDRALRAWSRVEKAIERHGAYESVVFDDPLIHAVISDMRGWIGICGMTDDQAPWVQKEFVRRYQGYVSSPPPEVQPKLVGIHERLNRAGGYVTCIPEPKLIGDVEKAKLILAQERKQLTAAEASEFLAKVRAAAEEL